MRLLTSRPTSYDYSHFRNQNSEIEEISKEVEVRITEPIVGKEYVSEIEPVKIVEPLINAPLVGSGALENNIGSGVLPGDKLRKKLINQIQRETMIKDYGGYKMIGSGFSIKNLMTEIGIPSLLESLGIDANIPSTDIERVLKLIKFPKQLPKALASSILPRLIKAVDSKQSGKGIKEIYESLKKKGLADTLAEAIGKFLKYGIERQIRSTGTEPFWTKLAKEQRRQQYGKGKEWDSFVRGFTSVFKPGAKILGGITSALGMPELGIPLTILSDQL